MSVLNVEFEIIKYFDVDGNIVVEVYKQGDENPLISTSFGVFELAREFIDIATGDDNNGDGIITDVDAADMAYEIVDELQDVIDYLNDHIEDPEELV